MWLPDTTSYCENLRECALPSTRRGTNGAQDDLHSSGADNSEQLLWGGWFELIRASWLAQQNDKPNVSEFAHLRPTSTLKQCCRLLKK